MISQTNLLTQRMNSFQQNSGTQKVSAPAVETQNQVSGGLLTSYLDNLARINAAAVEKTQKPSSAPTVEFHNDLRTLFKNNRS